MVFNLKKYYVKNIINIDWWECCIKHDNASLKSTKNNVNVDPITNIVHYFSLSTLRSRTNKNYHRYLFTKLLSHTSFTTKFQWYPKRVNCKMNKDVISMITQLSNNKKSINDKLSGNYIKPEYENTLW